MLDTAFPPRVRLVDPINWGIIGFGWVARDYVVPGLLAAGSRFVGAADPAQSSRREASARGAQAYADYAALLADPAVQAIYVATPNHLHRAAVEAAANLGKPVLCEKPMAATLADAEAMAAVVMRAGVPYGTAFDQRHHPAHAAIRSAIEQGLIGTVTAVRIVYACWLDSDWATDNWRIDPARAGGGALMDLAPHGLDLIEFLLGRTASDVLVQLHVAYNCQEALPRRRLEVVGTKGQIVAERTMGQTPGGQVWMVDGRLGLRRPLPVPDATESPFSRQIAAFNSRLKGQGDLNTFSLERDLNTMRLLARAYAVTEASECR